MKVFMFMLKKRKMKRGKKTGQRKSYTGCHVSIGLRFRFTAQVFDGFAWERLIRGL
jgi:hypothetical protein